MASLGEEEFARLCPVGWHKRSMIVQPGGSPASEVASLHKAEVPVPLEAPTLKILDWPTIFDEDLSQGKAEDRQPTLAIEELAKAIAEGMTCLAEEDWLARLRICRGRGGAQKSGADHDHSK